MRNALKTIEEGNLYSRFGLVEDLSEDEMMDVDGGWCACNGFTISVGCRVNQSKTGGDTSSSGGSSGSSHSSSSSSRGGSSSSSRSSHSGHCGS